MGNADSCNLYVAAESGFPEDVQANLRGVPDGRSSIALNGAGGAQGFAFFAKFLAQAHQ